MMRVQFTHNQEEIADALMRFNARSRVVSEIRRNNASWVALVVGVMAFLIFRFSGSGLIGGMAAAAICIILYPRYARHQQRKSTRKRIRECYGDENEFLCTVELLPEGLRTRTANVESMVPWETLDEIVPTSDSVDIFTRRGGVVIRNRAFSSARERDQFIETVRNSMNQARSQKQR